MDPVSHVAFGRTLVALTPAAAAARPGIVAAAILGALSPDVDAIVMPFGWDRYLVVHEIGTHSITGTLACALAVAALLRAVRRSGTNPSFGASVFAAWLGAASHVLLDLLSSARLRPGWPLVDTAVSLPAAAMADPWMLGLCVFGPIAIRMAPPDRKRRAAASALAALALFLVVKAGLGALAFTAYAEATAAGAPARSRIVEAEWASIDTWLVSDRTDTSVRRWRTRAGGEAKQVLTRVLPPETATVAASRGLSTVRNFSRAHDLAFHTISETRDGMVLVLWSDIRFCREPEPPIDPALVIDGIACGLWFGGEFDASGRPVREIVRIGTLKQSRSPTAR
jgi:membrane-bound metal-dependent hydrolase YbcI (DUF457 family)